MSSSREAEIALQQMVGSVVDGRYRVDQLIARGGMGAVFRAHHVELRRDVALKVLLPDISDDANEKRFEREALAASRLHHVNCVRVLDYGRTGSLKYLVMELIEGVELTEALGGPMTITRAIDIVGQILEGLAHAHHHGVVHRDLKPQNVLLTRDFLGREVVKIVDFGIARLLGQAGGDRITRTGFVCGTPSYLSPEQASGARIDARSDLYSLGVLFYEMLAGRRPFDTRDPAAMMRMHMFEPPAPLPEHLPAPLIDLVDRLLAKSPERRPASAAALRSELAAVRAGLAEGEPAGTLVRRAAPRAGDSPPSLTSGLRPGETSLLCGLPEDDEHDSEANRDASTPTSQPRPETTRRMGVASTDHRRSVAPAWGWVAAIAVAMVSGWILHATLSPSFIGVPVTAAPVGWGASASSVAPVQAPAVATTPPAVAAVVSPAPTADVGEQTVASPPATPVAETQPITPAPEPMAQATPPPTETERRDEPTHSTRVTPAPTRARAGACAGVRHDGLEARRVHDWTRALAAAESVRCWPDRGERERLLVKSLMELGRFSECARQAHGAADPDVARWGRLCEGRAR